MSLFSILVDIAANTANLQSGLEKGAKQLEEFGEQAKEVGEKIKTALEFAGVAVAMKEIIERFDQFVEHAVEVEHASQKTGLSIESFSRLEFAAKNAGVGTEQLASGLEKFAKAAEAATKPGTEQARAFAAIGVSVTDASGQIKPMEELLDEVADKFASYKDGAEKTALAQVLFGKSGADLIPLLDQGSKGIAAFGDRAQELGVVLDERTTKAAEAFDTKMVEVHAVADAFWQVVAGQLLPTLAKVADAFVSGGQGANKFQEQMQPLITGLKLLVDVAYSIYRTFMDVGNALGALSAIAVAVAHGHFSEASAIWKDYNEQAKQSTQDADLFLKKLWSDEGDDLFKLGDKVEEVQKKANAPIIPPDMTSWKEIMQQAMADLDKMGRLKPTESVDLGNKAADEATRTIEKQHEQWMKAVTVARDSVSQMQGYANQAAQSMQNSFEQFLFDPFKSGVKGLVIAFIDAIRKMIAQALSAQIMKALFGTGSSAAGGGSGLGGLLGSGLSAMFGSGGGGGASGGGMAAGGAVSAGQTYLVGEAGPELLTMGASGMVTPNHALGGGSQTLNHSPTYNIDARGADAERIMSIMPSLLAQSATKAKQDLLTAFRNSGMPAPRYA